MSFNLAHKPTPGNPCPDSCQICDDASAEALAAHLGLADADDDLDLAAEVADRIVWGLWSADLSRTYLDRDNPGEAEPWGPDDKDREWWAEESFYAGCGEDELSPEEQEVELYGESEWVAACKEHAREMEEREQEAAYHEMIGRLTMGGFPESW